VPSSSSLLLCCCIDAIHVVRISVVANFNLTIRLWRLPIRIQRSRVLSAKDMVDGLKPAADLQSQLLSRMRCAAIAAAV